MKSLILLQSNHKPYCRHIHTLTWLIVTGIADAPWTSKVIVLFLHEFFNLLISFINEKVHQIHLGHFQWFFFAEVVSYKKSTATSDRMLSCMYHVLLKGPSRPRPLLNLLSSRQFHLFLTPVAKSRQYHQHLTTSTTLLDHLQYFCLSLYQSQMKALQQAGQGIV